MLLKTERIAFMLNPVLLKVRASSATAENPDLLKFISKNLSRGIFKTAMSDPVYDDDIDFREDFLRLLRKYSEKYDDPEIMLFMIVELVSSACYSAILYGEPVDMETLKPYLYRNIRSIIGSHRAAAGTV
ncbi:MAG: hypothetical protein SOU50_04640 [Oscillospiraceae bacterium]|nr:hypothetical protein [Oscillospiraceae bacterium]